MIHAILGIAELGLACIPVYYALVGVDKMLFRLSTALILTGFDVVDLIVKVKDRV